MATTDSKTPMKDNGPDKPHSTENKNSSNQKVKTEKDPKKELTPWLDYQGKKLKKKEQPKKVGKSLSKLQRARRRNIAVKLGLILTVSVLIVLGLAYYLSPYSLVHKITVVNNQDVPVQQVLQTADLNEGDHVLGAFLSKKQIEQKLVKKYPSIKAVKLQVALPTTVKLQLIQHNTVAYLKKDAVYQKILQNGDVSNEKLAVTEIKDLPIFLGYEDNGKLTSDLKAFKTVPKKLRKGIKYINERMAKENQIILIMKDGNVILGDKRTIGEKMTLYPKIKAQLKVSSLVDFEIGAFSKPLSETDKKTYNS